MTSCSNKCQERGKIWLFGAYWSVRKKFWLNLQQNHKKRSPKHCQLKRKQTLIRRRLLFTKSCVFIFIQLIWEILNKLCPEGSVHSARYINEWMNEWINEWMNEESWMRGQQTCPLTIHFNMWTVSSDVSRQRRHWQPLLVSVRHGPYR